LVDIVVMGDAFASLNNTENQVLPVCFTHDALPSKDNGMPIIIIIIIIILKADYTHLGGMTCLL
jgi:hypothetical protein